MRLLMQSTRSITVDMQYHSARWRSQPGCTVPRCHKDALRWPQARIRSSSPACPITAAYHHAPPRQVMPLQGIAQVYPPLSKGKKSLTCPASAPDRRKDLFSASLDMVCERQCCLLPLRALWIDVNKMHRSHFDQIF